MLHFRGSIRDLDIGGNCQSQKSCNFDHFFVSRLPAALEQCRGGARQTWRGTVSGVGLGGMVWRRYGAVGRYAHGAMERHRCSVANRHGYGVVGQYVLGIMKRTGAMVWKSAGAALWGDADVVLGANAALRHGMARIRRCGVRPLWRHREVRGAVETVFRFGCQNGQIAKSFQNFIGKTHLKKIFLDGASTAKYFIKLCLFAKQPVATKEEMTRGSV